MQLEQVKTIPDIPNDIVRRVMNRKFLFADVVKELANTRREEFLGMSAVRDALLYHEDRLRQEDEVARFATPLQKPVEETVMRKECMYFVKN